MSKKIAVSACLLGRRCRYDGDHRLDEKLIQELEELGNVEIIPFCPEEKVLGVPRERIDIVEESVIGQESGKDYTEAIVQEAQEFISQHPQIDIVYSKSGSPSCALCSAKVFNQKREILTSRGMGVFIKELKKAYKNATFEERGLKKMLEVGQEAPQFCLLNSDEVEICLKDFRGKWVVLYFYPKDNTPGCTTEAIDFSSKLEEFEELGAVVIGVSPNSCESHRRFQEKHNLKVLLLCDPSKEVLRKYRAWGIKKMYGKEYEGVIRTTYLINPQGKIAHIWRNVRVKGHVDKVLEKLKELKNG